MKKAILTAAIYTILGILLTVAFLAVMTLCLAMPDILEWLSGYIGEMMTWTVFLFVVAGVILYCIKSK